MNNTAIKKVEKKQSIRQASKKNQQKLVFAWGVVLLVVRTTNLLSLFVE